MELSVDAIKKLISRDMDRRKAVLKAKAYYENRNDILLTGILPEGNDPMRNADNRIPHNFHQILTDEKAAYMFTYPVLFDVGNDNLNEEIKNTLGEEFESISKELCIECCNSRVAWLHYWDEESKFQYAVVPTEQIIPRYDGRLKRNLTDLFRYYGLYDDLNDVYRTVFEHWTDTECTKYLFEGRIDMVGRLLEEETFRHNLGAVPFIEFKNNNKGQSDLDRYKHLIDLYDKVTSGFANDLEDIQQVIYILENYGGENLREFFGDLKRYKAIKTESDGTGNSGSVKTLSIDIPSEARTQLLDIVKKQIYEAGQGLQQDVESVGNASGTALRFFYRKLELKAGNTETEFKKSFNKLVRVILKYKNKEDVGFITQTWTRNMISSDAETADIAQKSVGVIPTELILRHHPWVENPEEAMEMLEREKGETDPYDKPGDSTYEV